MPGLASKVISQLSGKGLAVDAVEQRGNGGTVQQAGRAGADEDGFNRAQVEVVREAGSSLASSTTGKRARQVRRMTMQARSGGSSS